MQDSPKKTKCVPKNKSIIIPISVLRDTFAKDITTKSLIDWEASLIVLIMDLFKRTNCQNYDYQHPFESRMWMEPTTRKEPSNL